MDHESDHVGQSAERGPREPSGGCAWRTRHDDVAIHTSKSEVSALRKKRGFRPNSTTASLTELGQ